MLSDRKIKEPNIESLVLDYVTNAKLSNPYTLEDLVDKVKNLSESDKDSLKQFIRDELPMDDWAYHGPCLESIPKSAGISVAAGMAEGAVHYYLSGNPFSALSSGLLTSAVTFFGQVKYTQHQINSTWDAKRNRANIFLKYLQANNVFRIRH